MKFGIFKNKKIIVVVLALLIAGGYFLWQNEENKDIKSIREAPLMTGYTVNQEQGKEVIENKEAGLRFEVPDGWEVRRFKGGMVSLFTKEKFKQQDRDRERECFVTVVIGEVSRKVDIGQVKKSIEKSINEDYSLISADFKVINISNYPTATVFFESKPSYYHNFSIINASSKNKVYYFSGIFWNPGDENLKKCINGFDEMLSTVSIE